MLHPVVIKHILQYWNGDGFSSAVTMRIFPQWTLDEPCSIHPFTRPSCDNHKDDLLSCTLSTVQTVFFFLY